MSPSATPRLVAAALLLTTLSALSADAQITVTRADVLAQLAASGTATSFDVVAPDASDELQTLADRSGSGQTWDLRPLPWTDETGASFAPASPPVPGSGFEGLAAATHIVAITQHDSTAYAFFDVSDTLHDLLGITAEVEDEGETMTAGLRFAPFDTVHPLPLMATSVWSSTYDLELILGLEGIETEVRESSSVQGWGTLLVPGRSTQVLAVRTRMISVTTITIPGQNPLTEQDTSYVVEFVSKEGAVASVDLDADGAATGASYTVFERSGTAGEGSGPDADGLALALRSANPVRRGAAADLGFTLDAPASVAVEAFDALGRRVAVLSAGVRREGAQRVALDTAGLPAGVYVVRLQAGGRSASVPVTVVQ